jgi:hypothetical protein
MLSALLLLQQERGSRACVAERVLPGAACRRRRRRLLQVLWVLLLCHALQHAGLHGLLASIHSIQQAASTV